MRDWVKVYKEEMLLRETKKVIKEAVESLPPVFASALPGKCPHCGAERCK